jgi:hypothetical protein
MMIMMIMMAPNSEANILQLSSSSSYALSLSLEEEPPYNNPVLSQSAFPFPSPRSSFILSFEQTLQKICCTPVWKLYTSMVFQEYYCFCTKINRRALMWVVVVLGTCHNPNLWSKSSTEKLDENPPTIAEEMENCELGCHWILKTIWNCNTDFVSFCSCNSQRYSRVRICKP